MTSNTFPLAVGTEYTWNNKRWKIIGKPVSSRFGSVMAYLVQNLDDKSTTSASQKWLDNLYNTQPQIFQKPT